MSVVFSMLFGCLFLAFLVAAVIGHALVIEALARPFFGKLRGSRPKPLPSHAQAR